MANTHAVMKSSLAKALIDAGVQHYDLGGFVGGVIDANNPTKSANITDGTNQGQLDSSYGAAQSGLNQNNSLVNQLQGQNGIQNQSNVFNQLQGQVNGTGPNPAQAMLNQSTGQNVSNQAALMAGQRGASSNAGLLARQIANQGANIQQQAGGQAASLQAQQSTNALNSLGGIAQNQVSNLAGATTANNTAAQNEQNILQNANTANNNANVSMQSNMNNVNGQIAQGNQAASNGLLGGLTNGLGGAVSGGIGKALGFADGGVVGGYNQPAPPPTINIGSMAAGPDQSAPFKSSGGSTPKAPISPTSPGTAVAGGAADAGEAGAVGGGADLSGLGLDAVALAAQGGQVQGKSKFPGNDYRNDVVPTMLSKGEVVLPESVTQAADPVKKAEEFMKALQAKNKANGSGDDDKPSYKKVVESRKAKK